MRPALMVALADIETRVQILSKWVNWEDGGLQMSIRIIHRVPGGGASKVVHQESPGTIC